MGCSLSTPGLELNNIVLLPLFLIFRSVCQGVYVCFVFKMKGWRREGAKRNCIVSDTEILRDSPLSLDHCYYKLDDWASILLFPGTVALFFSFLGFRLPKKGMRTSGMISQLFGDTWHEKSYFISGNIEYFFLSHHPDPERHAGGCVLYPPCTPGPEPSSDQLQWLCYLVCLLPGGRASWTAAQATQTQPGEQQYSAGKLYAGSL